MPLLPPRPPPSPKQTEERLKLAASGLQAVAITLIAGVLLGPALNAALVAPAWAQLLALAGAALAEGVALLLLRYIEGPSPQPPAPPLPTPAAPQEGRPT